MDYLKRVLGCIKKADNDYDLINEGDKIVIGVSGGKDSILLAYAINAYKRMVEKDKKFEIIAVHINLGFSSDYPTELETFFNSLNIPFKNIDTEIYDILKEHKENNGRLPCSICSRMKKAVINKTAIDLNYNKVAFAHHGDDAIETLVMNAIYGGRIATFSPKMHLDKTDITFIRPLIYSRENEISRVVKRLNLPVLPSNCPNDKKTTREEIKSILKELYHKYPSARDNFLLMLHNSEKLDLWDLENEKGNK